MVYEIGRISWLNLCMFITTDDVLDEYINKAAKLAGLPVEPAIPEEEQMMEQPVSTSMDS